MTGRSKRLIEGLTALCLAVVLTGCSAAAPAVTQSENAAVDETDTTKETGSEASTDSADEKTADDAVAGTSGAEDPAETGEASGLADEAGEDSEPEKDESEAENDPILKGIVTRSHPEGEAYEFTKSMGAGWNLGNTFDAYMDTGLSDEMDTETCWHGVRTTEAAIRGIKDAGFSTIRIPVSWHNHVSGPDHTISEQWMDRVNEVVDWSLDAGLKVIINIHHDNHPEANGYYPDKAHLEQSKKYVGDIWKQVAQRFKDYGDDLIFESLNEPRLVGHESEWWFPVDSPPDDVRESVECINVLNQLFLDTVRGVEGSHRTCYVLCPGYDASPDGVCVEGFEKPTDAEDIENRVLLSVHAYTPYEFALNQSGTDVFRPSNTSDTNDIKAFMNKLYSRYINKGTPVVITEFGALDKKGNLESRCDYAAWYTAFASALGIPCIWWDNNNFAGSGEIFGIYDREKCEFTLPEIKDRLIKYSIKP